MKKIAGVFDAPPPHWVGDGFHVRSLFTYGDRHDISPFILLDHASPRTFEPTDERRGVGWHPHRGFETVTVVYEGEVEHHDSLGNGGTIGPGDVQWMTAASGILHEEFHSERFGRIGGNFHMLQLWVNLPAKDKMTTPGYQTLLAADIPVVALPENAGSLRVIAGEYAGKGGAAKTHTPMDVFDLRLNEGRGITLDVSSERTLALVVLRGTIRINDERDASAGQLVTFERSGAGVHVDATSAANVFVLSGVPLDEPTVGYGPFVMNTLEEIRTAIDDFNAGKFGRIPA